MKNNGGPAFPSHGSMGEIAQEGMTLRDYFAARAMQSMLVLGEVGGDYIGYTETEDWGGIAKHAYSLADAMLAERDK